ncbi:unnamed protein product [Sphagnum balticum]
MVGRMMQDNNGDVNSDVGRDASTMTSTVTQVGCRTAGRKGGSTMTAQDDDVSGILITPAGDAIDVSLRQLVTRCCKWPWRPVTRRCNDGGRNGGARNAVAMADAMLELATLQLPTL